MLNQATSTAIEFFDKSLRGHYATCPPSKIIDGDNELILSFVAVGDAKWVKQFTPVSDPDGKRHITMTIQK
jgi:hypothetical protein